jgi:hypothetical protein
MSKKEKKSKEKKEDFDEEKETEEIEEELENREDLEELMNKEILKEIKENPIDSEISLEKKSAPVLEKIAEEQKIIRIGEEKENKEENLISYSIKNSDKKISDYNAPPRDFNQELLIDNSPNVNLVGKNLGAENSRTRFDTPESVRQEKNFENDYFSPEKVKSKNEDILSEKQEEKYKLFKPNS